MAIKPEEWTKIDDRISTAVSKEIEFLRPKGFKKAVHALRDLGVLMIIPGVIISLLGIAVTLGEIAFTQWSAANKRLADQATFEANTTQSLRGVLDDLKDVKSEVSSIIKTFPAETQLKILAPAALTVPTPQDLTDANPEEVKASLETTALFARVAMTNKVPWDPEVLKRTGDSLQTLAKGSDVPSGIRHVAAHTLTYIKAYTFLTVHPKDFRLVGFTLDCLNRTSTAITVSAPDVVGYTRPPLVNGTAALVVLQVSDPEDAAVYGVTVLNCSPVPGDPQRDCKQELTNIFWAESTFRNSTVVYDGGPLHLADAVFDNCQFEFGTDQRSREALKMISESHGKPVSIDFSGWPDDYHMTPLVHSNQ
jgi:hypothetical protein